MQMILEIRCIFPNVDVATTVAAIKRFTVRSILKLTGRMLRVDTTDILSDRLPSSIVWSDRDRNRESQLQSMVAKNTSFVFLWNTLKTHFRQVVDAIHYYPVYFAEFI